MLFLPSAIILVAMSTVTSIDLSARLRTERLRFGWTQSDIAARAGIPLRTYARFERLGQMSLSQFVAIASALGLSIELTTVPGVATVADPRAGKLRQRGVRHAKPKTAADSPTTTRSSPSTTPRAPVERTESSPARDATARPRATMPSLDADTSKTAEVLKRYRDPITRLTAAIVRNKLTNWTAAQLVRNYLSSNGVADADKAAYVAALLAELSHLTAENIVSYGAKPDELAAWQSGWAFDKSIPGVLE